MTLRAALQHLNRPWVGATALFLLAFSLRTCGLSHDLHHDRVYHPDTPKQIRAAERFIQGEYYTILGGRDYEGYPYFNSHLVALAFRGYDAARQRVRTHLGLAHEVTELDVFALFWLTRFMNAFWSATIVLLLYLTGARYVDRSTGLVAAALIAVSPVDITTSHFATGDTATSFFAAGALFFGVAIAHSKGRYRHYILTALLTGAAFSSKYHGGMALISGLVAHLTLYPRLRELFSRASLARLVVMGLSLIIGILFTSPALLVYPESAFKDILQFVEYTSSFGMTAEMRELPIWSRFLLGLRLNMPVLADVLGPGVVIAIGLALILRGQKSDTWIIAALPIAYILLGLATKPLTHPVYHTLATPALFFLGALGLTSLIRLPHGRVWARGLSVLLGASALTYAAAYTHRELFFFQHNDTRYIAETWAHDNIPYAVHLRTGGYTFSAHKWAETPQEAVATAFVFSDRDPIRQPPHQTFRAHSFHLENEKLSVFRNWNIHFYLPGAPLMQADFRPPAFQPLPSHHTNNLVFSDAPWLARTPKARALTRSDPFEVTVASREPMEELWIGIHAGPEPFQLLAHIGGARERLRLAPNETRLLSFPSPRAVFMTRSELHFYRARFVAEYGNGHLFIATTPSEIAWSLFHAGRYAEAYARFDPGHDPLGFWLSGLLAGARDPADPELHSFLQAWDRDDVTDRFFETFGVSVDYVSMLQGIQISLHDVPPARPYASAHYHLYPGRYRVSLSDTSGDSSLPFRIADPWGHPIPLHPERETPPTGDYYFHIDSSTRLIRIDRHGSDAESEAVLHIRADVFGTTLLYIEWLRALIGDTEAMKPHPLYYSGFVHLTGKALDRGDYAAAYRHAKQAVDCAPENLAAYTLLKEMTGHLDDAQQQEAQNTLASFEQSAFARTRHPASVRLANGMRLTGYRMEHTQVKRGEALRLHLYWTTPALDSSIHRHAVWLHGIPKGERDAVFYGDRGLRTLLAVPDQQDRLAPFLMDVQIPGDIPTGVYQLKTGIWIPAQRRNIRVRESDLLHDKRGVFLMDIEVTD